MTRPVRPLIILALALAVSRGQAEDTPAATSGVDANALPPVVHLHAGSMKVGFISQHPAETAMTAGASASYEKIIVLADAINLVDSYYPGTTVLALEHGRLSPGPHGPTPNRISFDSRQTELPRASFRGLLTPVSATIERMPLDPQHPLQVHFKVVMNDLGDFSGSFRHDNEWIPCSGWADHGMIMTVADITARGLGLQRMQSITFYGSATRRSEMRRADAPSLDPKAPPAQDAYTKGTEQTVYFGADGQVSDMNGGSDWDGDPGFLMMSKHAAATPVTGAKTK